MSESQNTPTWCLRVSGLVQGVGFRRFAQKRAEARELFGTVQNLEDGRVEIYVQATDEQLQDFLKSLRQGPLHGRVDHIEVSSAAAQNFVDFSILR